MGLSAEGCSSRRERLFQAVDSELIIICNPRHIQYLSGLYVSPLGLSGWGPNFLLIEQSGKSTLLIHNFIEGEAQTTHVDEIVVWSWYDAATHSGKAMFRAAIEQLNKLLGQLSVQHVGIEAGWLPRETEVGQTVDITDSLMQMRRSKDPDELMLIRQTVQAIEAGHASARRVIKPGISEIDVFNAIYGAIVEEANRPVLPMGDYVSGQRTPNISGPPTERLLGPGDLMILDVYPIINGYRADFTATVAVTDQLTEKDRQLEMALHAALSAGEGLLSAGAKASDVYKAVRSRLNEFGFGEGFVHHAGHGLGLGHPEAPFLVPESQEILLAGDVVTLEPGSYGQDFGARIEHNYLILENGFERLTHHQTSFVTPIN